MRQSVYSNVRSGELKGSTTALQMPDIDCSMVRFKAVGTNSGNVYIGGEGVTKINGATDATTGFELDAGDETDWLYLDNLSRCYRITDNAGDDLVYLALA